ncbi:GWxTD domain-containing protein [Candidatus Fermentibacteria bacterium]|nr:GWxTD domain-containing protein [Candidatus Fermentibacteria bacterium]
MDLLHSLSHRGFRRLQRLRPVRAGHSVGGRDGREFRSALRTGLQRRPVVRWPVALLLCLGMVAASGLSSRSSGDLEFGIDTAVFRLGDQDRIMVEVYEEIDLQQLARDSAGQVWLVTEVALIGSEGDTVGLDQWASRLEWMESRSIVNSTAMAAAEGEYTLQVTVTDMGNGRQGRVERPLVLRSPSVLSQLELAKTVAPAPEGSQSSLRKGRMLVFPAASGKFELPAEQRVYVYAELYDADGRTVQRRTTLTGPEGELLFARPWQSLAVPEEGQAVGILDSLSLLPARVSGLHYVSVSIVLNQDTLVQRKPLMLSFSAADEGGYEAGTTAADTMFFPELRYLLSDQEKDLVDGLTSEESRRSFYQSFWAGREDQREAFEQRCMEAERFGSQFREGWRTDRGRVYIKYGEPDDVETSSFGVGTLPYVIWYYYTGGNETFVFLDRMGNGDYEQIHSTVEGEVDFANWREMLTPVRSGTGSSEGF